MTYTFRKAVPGDINTLVRLRGDFMACFGPLCEQDHEALRNYKEYLLESMTAADPRRLPQETLATPSTEGNASFVQWLAECGGEIAATGSISFYRLPPTGRRPNGRAAYIGNMFTYPAYRNRGLAGEILRRLAEEAQSAGCGIVTLHTSEQGRPIYEAFGFAAAMDVMEYSQPI